MIDAEFTGVVVLIRAYPSRGDVRLETAVRPSSVRSDDESSMCFLHDAA